MMTHDGMFDDTGNRGNDTNNDDDYDKLSTPS